MTKGNRKGISNREVKDSAFTTFFGEPENASELYAALGDTEVSPEDITYVTLEGVLFIARKNDLAFTVKNRVLVISEHQSTINENMPLRDLLYLGRTLEKLLDEKNLYRRKMISVPTPEFYVFYNGDDPFPTEKILRLSDAYLDKTEHPMLELEVKVININLASGHRLLKECRPMYEYSWFIQQIKDYLAAGWSRDDAIAQAVRDCLDEGIMAEFMQEHGTEAVNMLYTQWNWDDAMEVEREEAYEDGVEAGKAAGMATGMVAGQTLGDLNRSRQDILDLLEDLGEIPEDIQSRIYTEEDTQILRRWHKAAAKAISFDAFRAQLK
ncbi:MAG: Rpn family recombination-promoting nuclease/putative transposase [Lachnospiraceae bacterium]|nr:Rpn family recombination-promoting nuclease/putative transposase [Lachnospiraceae bacterium]